MRELRAELSLGTTGVSRGVTQAKAQVKSLQSAFQQVGQSLTKTLGGTNIGAALKKTFQDLIAVQQKFVSHMKLMDTGDVTKSTVKEYGLLSTALEKATASYGKMFQAQQRLMHLGMSVKSARENVHLAMLHQQTQIALARNQGGRTGGGLHGAFGDPDERAEARSRAAASRVLNMRLQRALHEQTLAFPSVPAMALQRARAGATTGGQERVAALQALEQRKAILMALRKQRQSEESLAKDEKLAASHARTRAALENRSSPWSASPPRIQTGMAGWLQSMRGRYQANAGQTGGMQGVLGSMAGYFGGGRMGGLGGAMGGMVGMAGWGAAIGAAIGMIMGALRRLFDFFKNGIMEITSYAQHSRNLQAQTGIGPRGGMVMERAAEMGGIDKDAMTQWISRFQANLSVVEKTAPKVSNALYMLGLPLTTLRSMDPADAMIALTEQIKKVPNVYDKAGIAVALFNRQGASLLKIYNQAALLKIGKEQVGKQAEFWNAKDTGGNFKNRDALAYMADAMSSWTTKLRGFFAGMMDVMGPAMMKLAHWFNKIDLFNLGKKFASDFKPLMVGLKDTLVTLGHIFLAFVRLMNAAYAGMDAWASRAVKDWARTKKFFGIPTTGDVVPSRQLTEEEKKRLAKLNRKKAEGTGDVDESIAHPAPAGLSGIVGPLTSFFAPFGKGPGDAWSKMGAFSSPGMTGAKGGFATGIQGWRDKVVGWLAEIARNTRMGAPGRVLHAQKYGWGNTGGSAPGDEGRRGAGVWDDAGPASSFGNLTRDFGLSKFGGFKAPKLDLATSGLAGHLKTIAKNTERFEANLTLPATAPAYQFSY